MAPRINLFTAKAVAPALRQSWTPTTSRRSFVTALNTRSTSGLRTQVVQRRFNSSDSQDGRVKDPAQDVMPHISQESAETTKIMDKKNSPAASPELEQGTPISEILNRDEEARKHAPKVMQDQIKKPTGTRSFSTSARRMQEELQNQGTDDQTAAMLAQMISQVDKQAKELMPGLKFEAPETLPKTEDHRTRYDSLLNLFTKLMMKDGKLALAEKHMSFILDHLRAAPPPVINPVRPLLPGPPAPQLPLNPVLYLTLIVESVAPLVKITKYKGLAGGGVSTAVPRPLALHQRRRAAIAMILEASEKRRDTNFAQRVANELISVAEGRSGVWDKRETTHKVGAAGRAYVGIKPRKTKSAK